MTIALCHLVRKANGFEPFDRFISSYEEHDAGVDHRLVIIFKGFGDAGEIERYRCRLAHHQFAEVHVPDEGLDVGAYVAAAGQLVDARICFANSFSRILVDGWLGQLASSLDGPGTGLVGVSGSWASHRSYGWYLLGFPNVYRRVLGGRAESGPAFQEAASSPKLGRLRGAIYVLAGLPKEIYGYPSFPAPHIRTNAFAIDRNLFLACARGSLRTKSATYRFESGLRSLTREVARRGLATLMVTRSGRALLPGDWPDADVFWQGTQQELMVADNQTDTYERATPAVRRALSGFAWGERSCFYSGQRDGSNT